MGFLGVMWPGRGLAPRPVHPLLNPVVPAVQKTRASQWAGIVFLPQSLSPKAKTKLFPQEILASVLEPPGST